MQKIVVSKSNKSLLVPNGLAGMFPNTPVLGDYIVVPHSPSATFRLRQLGFQVPNPIPMYYGWCGGTPFDTQRRTFDLLTSSPRAYVLNDMGTGKSRTALWAWDALYEAGAAKKLLIVCKLSNMNFTWAREAFATLPHRKVSVLHGTKKRRLEKLDSDADIFIINHEGIKVVGKELSARDDINVLVLDELAVYRNNSDRSKAMRTFAQRFAFVWGLTGRPMPNQPTDVWAQCRIITPHTVPKYFTHAREMLMTKVSPYVWKPKPDAVEAAFKMMQPSVRFTLDEVAELPPCITRDVDVELSKEQQTVYDAMMRETVAMVKDKTITAVNAGVAMSKLLQIAGGWVYTAAPKYAVLDGGPRKEALLDIIEAAERKLLVFAPYRHTVDGLSEYLNNQGIEHAVVHGGTRERDSIFNLFQNTAKYRLLLAHPACISHGLTLTAADTVVWYLPTPSLDTYEQANARVRRVGQTHKQQFLHMQAAPVERKIYKLLEGHQRLQDKLLEMFEISTNGG